MNSGSNKYGSTFFAPAIFVCLPVVFPLTKILKSYPKLNANENDWCRERGVSAVFDRILLNGAGVQGCLNKCNTVNTGSDVLDLVALQPK